VSTQKEQHLKEKQILQALIDAKDLPMPLQKHLIECVHCRSQKEHLEQELARLGQLAQRYAPEPQKRILVTDQKPRSAFSEFLSGRLAFAAAAVAFVLIVIWGTLLIRSHQQGSIGNLAKDVVEAERLMTEINVLVENALPQVYLDIVGETNLNMDKDFMDFLIPTGESTPRISALVQKGLILC
jgi:hypothetical protein